MNIRTNLEAEYLFNGNANDTSGNGNNGTVTGATLTTDKFGRLNRAYSFTGTSGVDQDIIETDFTFATGDKTASFWFKTSHTGAYQQMMASNSFVGSADTGMVILITSTNYLAVYIGNAGGSSEQYLDASINEIVTDNEWHFVTATLSGTTLSLNLDNEHFNSSSTTSESEVQTYPVSFGASTQSTKSFPYTGQLASPMLWSRALSADEVTQLYNDTKTQYSLFDDCELYLDFKGNAKDCSGNGNDGTVTGATLTTDHLDIANQAYDFNGSSYYIDCGGISTVQSISIWINPTSDITTSSANGGIFEMSAGNVLYCGAYTSAIPNEILTLRADSNKYIYWQSSQFTDSKIPGGEWTHLAITFPTTSTAILYVNGVAKTASYYDSPVVDTNWDAFLIGGGSYYFNGKIASPILWSRALSTDEVTKLYDLTKHKYIYKNGN